MSHMHLIFHISKVMYTTWAIESVWHRLECKKNKVSAVFLLTSAHCCLRHLQGSEDARTSQPMSGLPSDGSPPAQQQVEKAGLTGGLINNSLTRSSSICGLIYSDFVNIWLWAELWSIKKIKCKFFLMHSALEVCAKLFLFYCHLLTFRYLIYCYF